MSLVLRWCQFNLVGAIGMAVQLAALSLLARLLPGRYLLATAAAIEVTLLHNFVWHLHFTWRDRRLASPLLIQCLRFHLANGLVSMAGNVALMPLLYRAAHLPLLATGCRLSVHCGWCAARCVQHCEPCTVDSQCASSTVTKSPAASPTPSASPLCATP